EHRLDQRLEAERGADLEHEPRVAFARVPEAMRRPRRDTDHVAGLREDLWSPIRRPRRPCRTSNRSDWYGWTCAAATKPPGRTIVSTSTDSPFVSADVRWKTSTSPVTGFSSLSPGRIISLLSSVVCG